MRTRRGATPRWSRSALDSGEKPMAEGWVTQWEGRGPFGGPMVMGTGGQPREGGVGRIPIGGCSVPTRPGRSNRLVLGSHPPSRAPTTKPGACGPRTPAATGTDRAPGLPGGWFGYQDPRRGGPRLERRREAGDLAPARLLDAEAVAGPGLRGGQSAGRQLDRQFGPPGDRADPPGADRATRRTVPSPSTKATSIGMRMKNVWIELQWSSSRPSVPDHPRRPIRPRPRAIRPRATSTWPATSTPRVRLRTRTLADRLISAS